MKIRAVKRSVSRIGVVTTRLGNAIVLLARWQPLTFRGALVLSLGFLALNIFAFPQSDLVAHILGVAAIALSVISAIAGLVLRLILKKRLTAEHYFSHDWGYSERWIQSQIKLTNSKLPPFFFLNLQYRFKHKPVRSRPHLVSGAPNGGAPRHLSGEVFFPHRGLWELNGFDCKVSDALGLCSYNWGINSPSAIDISAQRIDIQPLPVMASSASSGDQLSLSRERSGDLFDLKAYDPSDGTKRILWKTFARSRQLVVRRPEPAVMPEGELAIYLVAGRHQDYVAAAAQDYIRQLILSDIVVLFGTDGSENIELEPKKINSTINSTVWHTDAGTGTGLGAFLSHLGESHAGINRVLIFCAEDFEKRSDLEEEAAKRAIMSTFALVPANISSNIKQSKVKQGIRLSPVAQQSLSQVIYCQAKHTRQAQMQTFDQPGAE